MQRKRDKWRNDGDGEVDRKREDMFLFPGSIYFHFWPVRGHVVFYNQFCGISHKLYFFLPAFHMPCVHLHPAFLRLFLFFVLVLTSAITSPFFLHFSIFLPFKSLLPLSFLYFSSYALMAPFFLHLLNFPLCFGVSSSSFVSSLLSQYPSSSPVFLVP